MQEKAHQEQEDRDRRPQIDTISTVTELTQAIKGTLESHFPLLKVRGEVSNLRRQASGHIYFTLKDHHSQISAVLFRGNARHIAKLPKDGDEVILQGELTLYPPRGSYQIIVRQVELSGVGALLLKLHTLKALLEKRGWFDQKHKKTLPKYPKTIGVVTSATGSVIQDILHVLKRRSPSFHLILNPVPVQGKEAAEEIGRAIEAFNHHHLADVLIIGRGGGSLEDLWPFNEERVARAIFHSTIPIIAAIGHETDLSLADCVADVRAPTPSAAAEISVKKLTTQLQFLAQGSQQIGTHLTKKIQHYRSLLGGIERHPLFTSPHSLLSHHFQRVDESSVALDRAMRAQLLDRRQNLKTTEKTLQGLRPLNQVQTFKKKLDFFTRALHSVWTCKQKELRNKLFSCIASIDRSQKKGLVLKSERLNTLISHLTSIHPKNLLKKGYCIPLAEKGDLVMMSTHNLSKGDKLSLLFHDGQVKTTVDEVRVNKNE